MYNQQCRLCGSKLKKKPILVLKRMPKAAQFFPKPKEFKSDTGVSLKIYQCPSCRLVQLNSKPVNYFKKVITAASISGDIKKARLEQMKNLKNKYNLSSKKIIEIGCATGEMLDIIKDAGMDSFGMEASKKSVTEGRAKGRNIINAFIGTSKKISHGPFDAFISYNYLEHLPDPLRVIHNIRSNLSDNGIGLLTVPNLQYLLKSMCLYEFVADHLSYFTKETIANIFLKCGFKIKELFLINNQNDILIIVQKIQKNKIKLNLKFPKLINLKNAIKDVERLKHNLKKLVKKYKNKKIAIWGAGHRTLALLSISNLVEIEYIVDSAKFKQGKYSPILHKKILSPEVLKKNEIDLLLIMVPGIYPNEVVEKVKSMKISADIAKLTNNKIEFIYRSK